MKNAPSSATAKFCRRVEIDLEVIADLRKTLKNVESILDEEMSVRVGSISCNGRIMGPNDEMAPTIYMPSPRSLLLAWP